MLVEAAFIVKMAIADFEAGKAPRMPDDETYMAQYETMEEGSDLING